MLTTLPPRPSWAASVVDSPAFDTPGLVDPLFGPVPTWRLDDEPIYREVIRDLGIPGRLEGRPPGDVIGGEVVDGPPTVPLELAATTVLPVVKATARSQAGKPRAPRKRVAS